MSLFSRPAWAKAPTTKTDDDDDIFSHADRSYRDIVAEQERKKRERLERKKAKEERRSSSKRAVQDEPVASEPLKKRRITREDGEALLQSVGLSVSQDDECRPVILDDGSPARRSPRNLRQVRSPIKPPKPSRTTQVVEIGDDSDNEAIKYDALPPEAEVIPGAEEDSDDEFAELAAKARRERRQRQLNEQRSNTPDIRSTSRGRDGRAASTSEARPPTLPPDPPVQIFLSSTIPGTSPLIVSRKLSQDLGVIRKVWCAKQGFDDAMTSKVSLIYRMRKVYDATTCRGLGLYVDEYGSIVMKGAEGAEGVERVHLEAVTEEIFRQMKAEKEQEAKRRSGELPPEEDTTVGAAEKVAEEPKARPIRLVIKAKGRPDFKLIVKPDTIFAKITAAYCKQHSLELRETAFLEFDGERLDPEDDVQSTDIGDMDCIDIHL